LASQVDIANDAIILLGGATINAITDQTNQARAINAVWNLERDNELRSHRWKFSITRASLPALSSVPASGPYTQQFQLPSNCLRVLEVGDSWPGIDLSDYRSGPTTDDYQVEGQMVLCNLPAPLSIRYVQQITDPGLFDACFSKAFAAKLAFTCCLRITESDARKRDCAMAYKQALLDGIRANAMEGPPVLQADDSWIAVRPLGGSGSGTVRFG
jgi:hypothetical protein